MSRPATPPTPLKKRMLLASVSLPCLLLCTSAFAQVTIEDELTTAVTTSTIDDGAAANIVIDSTGSISTSDADGFVAVTVDSDNDIQNDGVIQIEDSDNSIGLLIGPNVNSTISGSGSITLIEDYTREDDDEDGDLDGALALGQSRTGVLVSSGGTLFGDMTFESGSSIGVEGNESQGIWLQSGLAGDFTLDGTVTVVGSDSHGLLFEDSVTGDVLLSGAISATGENAQGVVFQGDIGGALTIESSIASTGFTSTSLTNYVSPDNIDDDTADLEDRLDDEALLDGASAVTVGGSVANGILINGAVDDFISDEDLEDETKDTIEDYDENRSTGSVSSISSAPAFQLSPSDASDETGDLVIGLVREDVRDTLDDDEDDDTSEILATFDYDYGFINRGGITGNGLNVGFEGTGLEVSGSSDGTRQTIITGGLLNTGTISASAFEAGATAIDLQSGAVVPRLDNTSIIEASVASSALDSAIAILVEDGAQLDAMTNDGLIRATSFYGLSSSAIAVKDTSGTLASITNTGVIEALYEPTDDQTDDDIATRSGANIAIDLRSDASITDVTITQFRATATDDTNSDDVIDDDDAIDPEIEGNIYFGAGNDTLISSDGDIFGSIDFGVGDARLDLSNTIYFGDTFFQSGTHDVLVDNAFIGGMLSFSNGTGSLAISNGSIVDTQLVTSGSEIAVTVADAQLYLNSGTNAALTALTTSGDSILGLEVDPTTDGSTPLLVVSGTALIGAGTSIDPGAIAISDTQFTQTLIQADDLILEGTLDSDSIVNTPYIYVFDLALNEGVSGDSLDAALRLRTAQELGLNLNEAAAYDAVIDLFASDATLGGALSSLTDEQSFLDAYDSVLPQQTNAAARFLQSQSTAAYGALQDRLDMISALPAKRVGLWAQQNLSYITVDQDVSTGLAGYDGVGYGVTLGGDVKALGFDAIGIMGSFTYGEFEEKTGGTDPVSNSGLGLGLYAYKALGPINVLTAATISRIRFNSDRFVSFGNLSAAVEGSWNGWSRTASLAASSDISLSKRLYLRPTASVNYFSLSEQAYSEVSADGLGLDISSATFSRVSGAAMMSFGGVFVSGGSSRFQSANGVDTRTYWRPELSAGISSTVSHSASGTTASFTGRNESFALTAQETYPTALVGGASLNVFSAGFTARLGYDLERSSEGSTHVAAITVRLTF